VCAHTLALCAYPLVYVHFLSHTHTYPRTLARAHTHTHTAPAREDQKCRRASFETRGPLCFSLTHIHTLTLSRARAHTHTHTQDPHVEDQKCRRASAEAPCPPCFSLTHMCEMCERHREGNTYPSHARAGACGCTHTRIQDQHVKIRSVGAQVLKRTVLAVALSHKYIPSHSRARTHTHTPTGPAREDQKCRRASFEAHCPL